MMTTGQILFPPEYLRETAASAFESAMTALKAQGGETRDLAEVADAAFLVWQLADDPSGRAQQTIAESLPLLIRAIYARDGRPD